MLSSKKRIREKERINRSVRTIERDVSRALEEGDYKKVLKLSKKLITETFSL